MPAVPTPFHQYAEDFGQFLAEERARDAEVKLREEVPKGPSENTD
jgi:hypothetical protein